MLQLPVFLGVPDQTYNIELDGITYQLSLHYNERTERWYLDIETLDGFVLARGIKLVNDRSLLAGLSYAEPSSLVCLSLTQDDSSATLNDLGTRVVLLYIEHIEQNLTVPYDEGSLQRIYGTDGVFPL